MDKRKRYTPEEKVSILRELLEDGKEVSTVATEHEIHPNMVLSWRKQLFEGALQTFEVKRPLVTDKANERKAQALELRVAEKDSVIAELVQEVLTLKKTVLA
ncbi:transposase [Spirochaetia bacterium]|nr:transposase [Spirochaetia bacterium]